MTHVNAFYGDVEDKKLKLEQAKADLQAAEQRLKDHPDYEAPKAEPSAAAKTKK